MSTIIQKVALRNARFYAPIGFYEEERILGNEFYVSIEVTFPFSNPESEVLENTLNYEHLYRAAAQAMQPERQLLESAVEEMLQNLLQQFPEVHTLTVSILKKSPPFGGDLADAEVSLSYVAG